MTQCSNKACIVSHILPPSPSGQAMVLSRLLAGLSDESYALVSREQYRQKGEPVSADMNSVRYELSLSQNLSLLQKVPFENFRFFAYSFANILSSSRQLLHIIRKENCRVIIACSGDPFDLPAAYLASRMAGIPLIPYFFDDYLYQWIGSYRTLAGVFIGRIMHAAAEIFVPNEFLKADYERRYGVTAMVLHNPCILPDLQELDNQSAILSGSKVNIVYTGSVYHAHYDAFRNLVQAIELTKRNDLRLQIFTSQSEAELYAEGICGSQVQINSHVNSTEVPLILRQADILFLPLAFDSPIPEVIRTSAPGKTGEYLAAGKPILVHAPQDSFVAHYFKDNSCGIVVDQKDPATLADALLSMVNTQSLINALGHKAREQAEKDFDAVKIQNMFTSIVHKYLTGE